MRALIVAAVALLVIVAPARAADVGRFGLGSQITALVAGGDDAWLLAARHDGATFVGRAAAARGLAVTRAGAALESGTIGPDGQMWFVAGPQVLRTDVTGAIFTVASLPSLAFGRYAIATGPDATLWAIPQAGDRLVRVTAAGAVSSAPSGLPDCRPNTAPDDTPIVDELIRGVDGVLWVVDSGCQRLVRLASSGPLVVPVSTLDSRVVAADAAGGLWFGATGDDYIGHVDADGSIRSFRLPPRSLTGATDVAGAADGSAVYAFGTCSLVRVTAGGSVATERSPIPADETAFDAQGGLWLAARVRVARLAPGETAGACDRSGPAVRLRSPRRMSVAALRRDGLRYRVGARAFVVAQGFYDDGSRDEEKVRPGRQRMAVGAAGARRYRVPPAQLRRFARQLAAGRRPLMYLSVNATDADGNATPGVFTVRVTR